MMEKSSQLMVFPPYYKYIKTKYWKDFCSHWDTMYEIGLEVIHEKMEQLKLANTKSDDDGFLADVLYRSNLSDVQLNITLLELMLGGTDTVIIIILNYINCWYV